MAAREVPVESFQQYVNEIGSHQSVVGSTLWYRGCGKSSHKLKPTLYRHRTADTIDTLEGLEKKLVQRFRQRSIPFLTRPTEDDWDMLFVMQHYGVPTRLLDWSENPFVALFFAVTSCPRTETVTPTGITVDFHEDAAIWVLAPNLWNTHSLRHQGFRGGVLSGTDESLQGYKPLTRFADMNVHPVALYGAHNSPRIVAQRGVFTIAGQGLSPMEDIFDSEAFPPNSLVKIILKRAHLPSIRDAVFQHGISESTIFPDLEAVMAFEPLLRLF